MALFKQKVSAELIRSYQREGYFPVDMHFHTNHSFDALTEIPLMIQKAKKLGIGVAITDHNVISGALATLKQVSPKITILPGIEVTTQEGVHILSYFSDVSEYQEWYQKVIVPSFKKNLFISTLSTEELLEKTKAYNALTGAPHPYGPGTTGIMKVPSARKVIEQIDLFEVLNGFNLTKLNQAAATFNALLKKPIIGGSDGHTTAELGTVVTCTLGETRAELFEELTKNKTLVVGKESLFVKKTVLSIVKQATYLRKARSDALLLLKSQVGTQARYYHQRLKNFSISKR